MMESFPVRELSTVTFARTMTFPRPVMYASRMPFLPRMIPPVGKSGPRTIFISSSIEVAGSAMSLSTAAQISRRFCGGMFVAMPTAMPLEPLASRNGNAAGSTRGSVWEPS